MNLLKFVINYLKNNQKRKKRINDRDLNFLGLEFFNFLNFIFSRGETNKTVLRNKLGITEENFNLFKNFALSKNYICQIIPAKGEETYTVKEKGIDFLLESKKLQNEEKNSNTIKWATIVLAISALIQIFDILINKPATKKALSTFLTNIFIAIPYLIKNLIFPFVLLALIFFIITKIVKCIKIIKKVKLS